MAEQPALGFAGLLRQLRAQARLTQEELAEAAGLSPRSVSDLERGINRTARKDTAELLAAALGLAEPVRPLFVAAARGRVPAAEVLAALQGEAPGGGPARLECPYLGLVRCSADVQFVRVVLGELRIRRHIGHAERLERGEELLGGPPVHMGLGLPHGHHVEPVLVRAGRPGEQAVDVLGRVVLGGDRAEAVDRCPGRRAMWMCAMFVLPFLGLCWQE